MKGQINNLLPMVMVLIVIAVIGFVGTGVIEMAYDTLGTLITNSTQLDTMHDAIGDSLNILFTMLTIIALVAVAVIVIGMFGSVVKF